jgi:hypothetical protein
VYQGRRVLLRDYLVAIPAAAGHLADLLVVLDLVALQHVLRPANVKRPVYNCHSCLSCPQSLSDNGYQDEGGTFFFYQISDSIRPGFLFSSVQMTFG